MNRSLITTAVLVLNLNLCVHAQDFGLSFSYFLPRDGYFSVPVSPFSVRGLGFRLFSDLSLESGFSLYRMSGMNVRDLPFSSREPLIGPFFSLFVPLELVWSFDFGNPVLRIKGGGFGFYNFATKINYGNLDRALADHLDLTLANSEFDIRNLPGFGYRFGPELVFQITRNFGLTFEAYYLRGSAPLDMRGSVLGLPAGTPSVQVIDLEYPEARLDFSGLELSVGVLLTP